MTTREAATWLGVTVRTVQLMVDRGDLQAWKTPGGHRRIDRASVETWRASPSSRATSAQPADPKTTPPVARQAATAGPLTVVLMESDPAIQRQVKHILTPAYPGHHLYLAHDGVTGITLCGALNPDVVLMSTQLPGLDGLSVARGLAHHHRLRAVPLVLLVTDATEPQETQELAHVHCIPFNRLSSDLLPVLSQALA